ncbi:hypothetical protein COEX109129_38845 [Corallococcus exiguus]
MELLADCCARASDLDLDRLGSTCYQLQDAARWESGEVCAQAEFELLRHAARVAARPGHVLLVQSLQRAFLGGAAQLLPLMGGEALREWAFRVMAILNERDVQALQHELPALLKVRDERVLNAFAPASQEKASPEAHVPPVTSATQDSAPKTHPCTEERDPGAPTSAPGQDASQTHHCVEEHRFDDLVSTAEQDTAPEDRLVKPNSGQPPPPAAPGCSTCEFRGECTEKSVADAALEDPFDCRSG